MAVKVVDSVVETTQTTGTGTLDLDGAQTGFRSFADELTSGDQVYYCIEDDPASPTAYEVGIGTFTAGSPNTLSRDVVLKSSNAGNRLNLVAGGYTVTGVLPAAALALYALLGEANTFTANQTIRSTDDGSGVAPTLSLDRASASPAASDELGNIVFRGRDAGGNATSYADIYSSIQSTTDGAEGGALIFRTMQSGTLTVAGYFNRGLVVGNPTGTDKGAGTINATAYYEAGARVAGAKVAGVVASNALQSGSLGVGSVSRTGPGTYQVTFSAAFANTSYIPIASGAGGAVGVQWFNRTTTGVTFVTYDTTTGNATDSTFSFVIFGTF